MKTLKTLFLTLALFLVLIPRAFAMPTIHDIYEADQHGDFRSADKMMSQVLAAVPNSAKAHYVHACLLADEGKMDAARTEFSKAESLDPTDGFANAQSVQALRSRLNPPQVVTTTQSSGISGFTIFLILIGVGVVIVLIAVLVANNRRTVVTSTGPSPLFGSGGGAYGGYNYRPASSRPVILNNNTSNDGFITGMVVGEALSGDRGGNNTTINETVVNSPEPSAPSESRDFGTTSGNDSSSQDFGTSSDSSSSSSDWGTSDSGSSSDFGSDSGSGGGGDWGSSGGSDGGNNW